MVNPAAATLNVPSQGTLDRTAYLHLRLAAAPACSWEPAVALGQVCDNVSWSTKGGYWWALGGANVDVIRQSTDFGKSWANVAIGLDSLQVFDLDFSAAGDAIVTNNGSRTLYKYTGATGVWSHDVTALIGTVLKPRVRYEPTNALWACFYTDTTAVTGAMHVATSTDGITWTDRGVATGFPAAFAVVGTFVPHLGVGGGNIVVAAKLSGTTITVGRAVGSAPATWSSATLTATNITTLTDCSDPVFCPEDGGVGTWVITLYGTGLGAAPMTEIWKSVDGGITWTQASTIINSGVRITAIANLGHMVAGVSVEGFIFYSLDVGTTWFSAGMHAATAAATAMSLKAGGGGLILIDSGGATSGSRASSVRLSNQGASALT